MEDLNVFQLYYPTYSTNISSIDEADILMAAVNYILSLTSQLQHKLRWGNNNSFLNNNNNNTHCWGKEKFLII